jgi:hypothetical protein
MLLNRCHSRSFRKKHKSSATTDDSITKYAHNSQAQRIFKTAPLYAVTNPEESAPQDIWTTFTTFFERLWSPSTNPDGSTVQKVGMSYVYDVDGALFIAPKKRAINADAKLLAVFGKPQVTMFELAGIVGKHLS